MTFRVRRWPGVSLAGVLGGAALLAIVNACDNINSRIPTSPSAPGYSAVEISGPDTIAPGTSAQFTALVRLSAGARKQPGPGTSVTWGISSGGQFLHINNAGVATAVAEGDATVFAQVRIPTSRNGFVTSSRDVVVGVPGTFRLVGRVNDSQFPTAGVPGAVVTVTPGSHQTTTDTQGGFTLHSIPADATVQIVASGYNPFTESIHLSSNTTRTFLLEPSGPRPDFSGNYTLAIDLNTPCSGSFSLPSELQHRQYDATLTQNGPAVDVRLTEPRFRLNALGLGNHFSGTANVGGATFTIRDYPGDYYYPFYGPSSYPDIAERLADNTVLVTAGTAVTTSSGGRLSGNLTGEISHWNTAFPKGNFLGGCFGSQMSFTLTPR